MTSTPPDSTETTTNKAAAIIVAASRLFSERGFDGVSMSAVATAAGVSKANVFHHFGSKGELYMAVMRQCHETFAQHLRELSLDESQGLGQRFGELARSHLAHLLDHEPLARLFMRELLARRPEIERESVSDLFAEEFSRLVRLLRDGQKAGQLRTDFDPALAVSLLVGANIFFFQARDIIGGYPEVDFAGEPERYTAGIADLIWRSLTTGATEKNLTDENLKP